MTTTTFTTAGSHTYTAPAGVTSVFVECWGGGGGGTGGSSNAGGGGGGGEYAAETAYAVTPGNVYNIIVGGGGGGGTSAGTAGSNSTFDLANGGIVAHNGFGATSSNTSNATGGAGGAGSTNSIHFNGGSGGSVNNSKVDGGSGGGSSGGSASAGNNGVNATNSGPGAGGSAVTDGGAGGAGSGAGVGNPGGAPGGGAGGGFGSAGGSGATGQVRITDNASLTKTGTDTGSFGSETGTVQIIVKGTDTGTFAENTPGFKIQVSDTGSFDEAGVIHATLSDTDFFTTSSETGSISILIVGSDTGSFSETSAQALTGVIDSDSGSFMEAANITAFEAPPITPLSIFYPTIAKPVVSPIYYGITHTSTVGVVRWTTFTTEASRIETDWKIIAQQIVAQQIVQYNAYYRRHKVSMGYKFGLPNVIVHPIDWRYDDNEVAWQNEVRRSAQSGTSWTTLKQRMITKRTDWMLMVSGATFRRTRFNTLLRVSIPTDASTRYYGIEQPVSHPIGADSLLPSASALQWDIDASIIVRRKVQFNALDSRTKKIAVWWNANAVHVVKQSGTTWMLRERKNRQKATAWKVIFRWPLQFGSAWMDNHSVIRQRQVLFNDLLKVRKQSATQWEATQHVTRKRVTSFRVYVPRKTQKNSKFNTRFRYSLTEIPGTYRFNARVVQSTVHPITFAPAFAPAEQSTWNFIFEVTTQKAAAFSVHKKVTAFRSATWASIHRASKQQRTQFNTVFSVTEQAIIEWNVGEVVSERIHQTSIDRVDFAY